ncbi:MAG: hypothetical protein H0X29_02850 [Parachlamydiaceae bacterium]|nr:hypothetical protein [Parachlamydiaceae bacterium]
MNFNVFSDNFVNSETQSINLPSAKTWTKHPVFKGLFSLKANYLMYDHPTTRKVAKFSAYIIGAGLALVACFVPTTYVVIGLALTSVVIIGTTYLAARILNCLVPTRHDMKNHAYLPEKLEKNGILLGEIYYDKDVPILKIESTEPYQAGYTYGYLLGKKIADIRHNIEFCLHTLSKVAKPSQLSKSLQLVKSKIPSQYLKELKGVVDGYNARKSKFEKAITLDDLVFLQLMPDMGLISPNNMRAREKEQQVAPQNSPIQLAACSLAAIYDQTHSPLIARNMDWQSFGNIGALSLIVSRVNATTGIQTAEIGVPGLLGTVTGINNQGMCVAMNVTPYFSEVDSFEGIPSAFYNRLILDNCSSFNAAKEFVAANKPLGPYHLTVSDKTKAGTFSMYQEQDFKNVWDKDKENGHVLRMLSEQSPLITTNCSCNPTEVDMFQGKLRKDAIGNYLQAVKGINDSKEVLSQLQSIPFVNNQLSTHRVVMGPNILEVAVDNAWVGDQPLHSVDLKKLFS